MVIKLLFRLMRALTRKFQVVLRVSGEPVQRGFLLKAFFFSLYWTLHPFFPGDNPHLLNSFFMNHFSKADRPRFPVAQNKIAYDRSQKRFVWRFLAESSLREVDRLNPFAGSRLALLKFAPK